MKFTFKLILKNMRKVFKNFFISLRNQQSANKSLFQGYPNQSSKLPLGSSQLSVSWIPDICAVRGHHGFLEILQVIILPAMQ